jgi:phosphohistidine swiveling domain-containing protein
LQHPLAEPKWKSAEVGPSTRILREEIMARIQANLDRLGAARWSDVVNARWEDLLSAEDCRDLEAKIFTRFQAEADRKYYAGCEIAVQERPDRYVLRSQVELDVDPSEFPEGAIGDGDNVFQTEDITGTIMVIREVGAVDRLIEEGVPEGTIGVIDDAGGTMTAPILPDFDAVICLAGTVRSHLAIIAREFGVPTLMGARLSRRLVDGERVTVGYSAKAQNVDGYFGEDLEPRAEIREAREQS